MGEKANPRAVVRQVQLVEWPYLGNVERRSSDCLFYLREWAFEKKLRGEIMEVDRAMEIVLRG